MIYFVTARQVGLVKIGFTGDPRLRLKELQVGSPVALKLERVCGGSAKDERALHRQFSEWRRVGEWFEICAEIERHMEGLTLPEPPRPPKKRLWRADPAIKPVIEFTRAWQVKVGEVFKKAGISIKELSQVTGIPYNTLRSYFAIKTPVLLPVSALRALRPIIPDQLFAELRTYRALAAMRGSVTGQDELFDGAAA